MKTSIEDKWLNAVIIAKSKIGGLSISAAILDATRMAWPIIKSQLVLSNDFATR